MKGAGHKTQAAWVPFGASVPQRQKGGLWWPRAAERVGGAAALGSGNYLQGGRGDKKVWNLIVVMVVPLCEYTKNH